MVLPDSDTSNDYDHLFFYQCSGIDYSVSCKLYSHPLIINLLNEKMFGIDIDVNNLKFNKSPLSLCQKLYLEDSLKKVLPIHLSKNRNGMRSNIDENKNKIFNGNDDFSYNHSFENVSSYNNGIFYEDENGHGSIQHPQQQVDFSQHQNFYRHYTPDGSDHHRNTNSFHGNIENNIMMTQVISTTGINQNCNDIGFPGNDHVYQ